MLDAIRVVLVSPLILASSRETMVNNAAAMQMKRLVRIPAGRLLRMRSRPTIAPSSAAQSSRYTIVEKASIACLKCTGALESRKAPYATCKNSTSKFELTEFPEMACPGVYLFGLKPHETTRPEFFDGKTTHHGAINHCTAKVRVLVLPHS